ncbi:Uncharacterized protein RSN1 [Tolypocladium capitatum]|uniref:Uncharacterized protein RSN1 n=1 Tax=Tolypocladium capitatum TaxID=45235 RepID=A0A2K3QJ82_9HYPO|nr:Uncharacterized protein RSN1 [Tolypocladium capitatum]
MAASLLGSALSWAGTIAADAAFVAPPSLPEASSPWSTPVLARRDTNGQAGRAQDARGIGIVSFLTAIGVAAAIFAAQFTLFTLLRNKLARIFKPKTYLVPERERTESPPGSLMAMIKGLIDYSDREVIDKCGLDAYFFLRYLKTLLVIFIPICAIVLPILIPINYIGGKGHEVDVKDPDKISSNSTPTGLDTLAWGNVSPEHTSRYGAHLVMAILVVIWVCAVFFFELRVYIKVRQDYLTSAEHRLRASATTVLVNSIPQKWLSEEALLGLFDVFPGGVRNIWLNRDLTKLLDKISLRDNVHSMLESAETDLIKAAKKAQLKQRDADEKKKRKKQNLKSLTKEERAARDAQEDAEANQRAISDGGTDAGNQREVPHTVDAGVHESEHYVQAEVNQQESGGFRTAGAINPPSKVGKGFNGVATKAGSGVVDTLGTRNGFMSTNPTDERTNALQPLDLAKAQNAAEQAIPSPIPPESPEARRTHSHAASTISDGSTRAIQKNSHTAAASNRVRAHNKADDMILQERTKFWQFWKPPSGGYASPVPQGAEAGEFMARRPGNQKTAWQTIKRSLPFTGGEDEGTYEYPSAYNVDYKKDEDGGAEWEKYLKKKHRPTHRLPPFGITWLLGLPLFNKKVDTIYWCREELARLNLEIEEDQKHPERFPLMPSAFVQFNHQVAAHMACQSVVHHLPRQMSPRMNEISPRDVVWDNMALTWWQEWLRTAVVTVTVSTMIFLWAIPVAWTAALSQLDKLIENAEFLSYLKDNKAVGTLVKAIAGVLPAAMLAILLILVPIILTFLAGFKGAKTGAQKTEFVQIFYFVFLFVQVFLIVSIASFFARSLNEFVDNIKKLSSVGAVLDLLADNLPASANYFFSYMVLQALSTSSGTLLQVGALLAWFVLAPMFDSTARNKWSRNTKLNQIRWGSFFPVYTNFACIGLVYCVIAPLISVFAIITFSLLWLAQRYAMLYVIRFETDTGGVLYPRAINQTFTGIYFMELCMAGLFFIVQDNNGNHTCTTHGVVMIVVLVLTIIYQVLLNMSFSPLFRYLPITFEDEAVLRDEAFQRAQDCRFGVAHDGPQDDEDDEDDEDAEDDIAGEKSPGLPGDDKDIELQKVQPRRGAQGRQLRDHVKQVGSWARDGGKQVGTWAKDGGNQLRKLKLMSDNSKAAQYRRQQRQKDLEAQRAIGEALYGSVHDDIEDLTPEERDMLTRHAFQHYALRARRPTVWIPRDDLGVSDDEIRRTRDYSEHIWISNEGTALDSKVRVVYGKNPPDFSEVDLINL